MHARAPAARVVAGTRAVPDSSERFVPALDWLGGGDGADRNASAERRAESLVSANAGLLRDLGVTAMPTRRAGEPGLLVSTSTRIGAVPLLSPVTGRPDFGLVVEPRFTWSSAGDMLAGTGFRVVPDLLPLPDLPQSERRVPPWVLSSVVLMRLKALLESLQRRFVFASADVRAPRGQVDWSGYATRFALGRALDVPCRFPDLREDEELRAAIHWVVRRHRDALLGQAAAGLVVRRLLALCDLLLARLSGTPPRMPEGAQRRAWSRRSVAPRAFREGLLAIDWTIDERGLAGLSDLSGLAWRMDMETFFEAWVESVAEGAALRTGTRLRAGRRHETRVPLDWKPPSAGSQRSLIPDVILERPDVVVVLDAKYKRHADQIERLGWLNADATLREQHRNDVLQALAYSTLFNAPRIVACLVYPASPETWRRLVERGRVSMRAKVRAGARNVELALVAVPLSGDREAAGAAIEEIVRGAA